MASSTSTDTLRKLAKVTHIVTKECRLAEKVRRADEGDREEQREAGCQPE
jgi:hypothetical protein